MSITYDDIVKEFRVASQKMRELSARIDKSLYSKEFRVDNRKYDTKLDYYRENIKPD